MAYTLDFDEIKAQHKIEDVAKRLGLTLKKTGNQLRGKCFSGDGGDRALVITPGKGLWYSFGLQEGGDAIKLVQLVNDCSAKEAAAWIAGNEPLEKRTAPPKEDAEARGGFRVLEYLEHDHPAVEALGLEPEDAQRLGIGYCPRGIYRGKVAVPIRTEDGTLRGYIGLIECQLPPKWC